MLPAIVNVNSLFLFLTILHNYALFSGTGVALQSC